MKQRPFGDRRMFALAFLLALVCGWGTPRSAAQETPSGEPQAYDARFFGALEWRNVGPNRGGRSIGTTGVPGRPLEAYFGAVGGGLWKTTDGGTTWRPVTDGQLDSSSVGAVAVAESNPDVVYIGMGEACLRGNVMQGDGVYKSTDAGETWTHMGLADSEVVAKLRIHPTNPDLVYAAVLGHVAAPHDERGVFRSRDGGQTWERVLFRDDKTGAVDLVMDPNDPDVLYAAFWEAYRVSWQMSSGGPGSGLFKSTDGGDTWTELTHNTGMPNGVIGRIGVAVAGTDSRRVYAIVEAETGGVFRSDDAGATWTKINDERRLRQRAFYYNHIYADPTERDTVYVLNTRMYRSTDGGQTFSIVEIPHGDAHDLWIDPENPRHLVNANDGGGCVSFNGGETWTDQRFPTSQLYHVTTTKEFPYHICGAQQDNSTVCVPSDGWENLRMPRRPMGEWMYAVGGGESGYIAPHPTDPNIFYAGSQGALLTRFDRRTGQTPDVQPYPRFFSGEPSSSLPERWQWTFPIVFSPQDPKVLYTCSQHVWKTTNEGWTWERISPDLTRADPTTLGDSGGPITRDQNGPELFATVFALAPSQHDQDTLWAGSDDGLIHITRDGGANWEEVTPGDLPELIRVSTIDASPHRPGSAYLAAKNYLQDDRAPYIYKTHDYGQTWTKIVSGIPMDDYAHVVREDPQRAGLLYAGTEHGVYVSFDDGTSWQSLRLNVPDTQVADLVVEEKDLVLGTHGRSFYVLDDIGVLRQLRPEVTNASVHLFAPADAVRRVENAVIDYYLADRADRVTIEILDSAGATVQTFTGTPELEAHPPERPFESRVPLPEPPGLEAGMHRFEWDLRYPAATPIPGMFMRGASPEFGPFVLPSTYRVRLTANGQTVSQTLAVELDPRLSGVTQADLETQLELALRVRDRTSEAHEAVLATRRIKAAMKELDQTTSNREITASAEVLAAELTTLEEEIYQYRLASRQDLFHHPIKLNNRLAGLERVIESGEARPTDQSYEMFTQLASELDRILSRLDALLQRDLAEFNQLLAEQELETIDATRKR